VVDIGKASDEPMDVARHKQALPGLGAISRTEAHRNTNLSAGLNCIAQEPTSVPFTLVLLLLESFQRGSLPTPYIYSFGFYVTLAN